MINTELDILTEWFNSNFLTVNPSKTQALTLGSLNHDYTLQLNNTVLEVEDTLKILGVIIDKNLSFKEHLKDQLKKCNKTMIRPKKHTSYIPHLEYCSPILIGMGKTQSE